MKNKRRIFIDLLLTLCEDSFECQTLVVKVFPVSQLCLAAMGPKKIKCFDSPFLLNGITGIKMNIKITKKWFVCITVGAGKKCRQSEIAFPKKLVPA